MGPSGEQPPELPTPHDTGVPVRLEARASGEARINQAGRDLHLHYQDDVRRAWRVEPGTQAGECPYPGLASFGREQAQWFFGRDELTSELVARLDGRLRTGGVQVVVAPSGAGKSSLLHAGLLPQLDAGALPRSSRWSRMVFTPTADPLSALMTQIAALTGADPATLAEDFVADSRRYVEVLRRHLGGEDSGARVVVVVDQLEELFTLCTDDQRRGRFIELLSRLAGPRSGGDADAQPVGLVVVGVRADFYAACVNYPELRIALQDKPLVVGPMSDTELRAAIRYPARAVGLDVEAGLVELLLQDMGDTAGGITGYESGRLPLLAHALRTTWQQRHGHTLTVEGYKTTGGIHRAVATTAEGVFTGLDPAGQHAARTLFLRLIKIGDGTEDTRRRVARTGLLRDRDPGSVSPVVDAFTRGRLLTQERDTVEITHEALVRAWPRLRQWIDSDRAGNLIRQELEEATAVWDREGRDTAALYRGSRLETARTWATSTSHEGDLSSAASAFLDTSTAAEEREHTAARRRTQRLRQLVALLTVLFLLATATTVIAVQAQKTATQQRNIALSQQVAKGVSTLRVTNPALAAQISLAAHRLAPTIEASGSVLSVFASPYATRLIGHSNTVNAVAFSPNKQTLATASDDRKVRLWDVTDPHHPQDLIALSGHTKAVESVAFSPDGRTLATASDDCTARLWDVTDPHHPQDLAVLTGHTLPVYAVAFSPNRRTLATSSNDMTVRLWDVTDPTRPMLLGAPLIGHTAAVRAVGFSPDGKTLATASFDHTVRLWNVTDPHHPISLSVLTGHTAEVRAVGFSPDGRTMATASFDQTARLWDVTDLAHPTPLVLQRQINVDHAEFAGRDLVDLRPLTASPQVAPTSVPVVLGQPLTGHIGRVLSVVFSPDGHTLATGSADATVLLWDVADSHHPMELSTLTGHEGEVASVAFSPDGHTLATGSWDHTARLWDVPGPALTGHTNQVASVAFSPDGHTLASGSYDHTTRLWDVTDPHHPRTLATLTGHTDAVFGVAFSPDGHTLATGSRDRTVRLWDVTDPQHPTDLAVLTGYADAVFGVAFSRDGRTLATASNVGTSRLWDVTDPHRPKDLAGLNDHTDAVNKVVFSPDGRTLATTSNDRTASLWDITDPHHPKGIAILTGHTDTVYAVAFSRDGCTLATTSSDRTARLWDVTDPHHPSTLATLTGFNDFALDVVFSRDGRVLATTGNDGTRLWNIADPHDPKQVAVLADQGGSALVFSPDGRTLAAAGGTIELLWETDIKRVATQICDIAYPRLTRADWDRYFPNLPYDPPCP